ncbi:Na/Pi cotransporter family protein [Dapis sp. BLCC M172]|uniref:Na/Pi cotransporter family protein n=1 Tax=Dapis sp. BLCC M172 TaxID=2975281 RepID=UPI003CE9E320
MTPSNSISLLEFGQITVGLCGGLAFFLFGLEQMTESLKQVAGKSMKRMLAKLTSNRWNGLVVGAFVTAVLQSSSVTTVLVVGFISAGLMTMPQSIGVIMGANIGSTITAQIIAFKITRSALVLFAIGFVLQLISQRRYSRQYGLLLMGLGMMFYGMELMKIATSPLQAYPPFISLMQQVENPLLGITIATVFTALVQSSAVTTGLVIVLASQGLLNLEAGIALVFGANIGTCITAMLAAIGKPSEAVQAAIAHVLFNILGVLLWVGFINQLADTVRWLTPASSSLEGMSKLAVETPRQIANAHTLFNVANAFIFIGFAPLLAKLVEHLLPAKSPTVRQSKPKYLDKMLLTTPTLALDRVRLELGQLGNIVLKMLRGCLPVVEGGTSDEVAALRAMDDEVDRLYGAIVTYLGQLSLETLVTQQFELLSMYLKIANYIENIGDTIETNMVEIGNDRLHHELQFSDATQTVLKSLHEEVCFAVDQAIKSVVSSDPQLAAQVVAMKPQINELASQAHTHLAMRLTADQPNRLVAFGLESDFIEYLKRVYYFAKRIAKLMTEMDLEIQGDRIKNVVDNSTTEGSTINN